METSNTSTENAAQPGQWVAVAPASIKKQISDAEAVLLFREGKSILRISLDLWMRPAKVRAAIRERMLELERRGKPLSCIVCGSPMSRKATSCRQCWRSGSHVRKGRPL